jgi:hypothetical protein
MLFKRGKIWYYKFTVKGRTVYRSTGTDDKEQAQEIEAKAHYAAFNQLKLGEKPRYAWQDAVIRWLNESENKSIETENTICAGWHST